MYLNPLKGYEGRSFAYVRDRNIYVATFDVWWRDDVDIVDGSYVVYCTIDPKTEWIDILDIDGVPGKLCDEEGSVIERIPTSFEDSLVPLLPTPA